MDLKKTILEHLKHETKNSTENTYPFNYLHINNFYFIFYLATVSSLINFLFSFLYSGQKFKNQTSFACAL